jgi:hypothetical protein
MPAPRARRFHPVLLLVIIVILAAIGHVVLGVFMPLLWIAFLGQPSCDTHPQQMHQWPNIPYFCSDNGT